MPALDEFEARDVPAALAPFDAFNADSIRPALKLLEDAAQDVSATFNLNEGTFVFSVQGGARHAVYPWMLLRGGSDCTLMLAPFPPDRRSAISEAVLQIWGWMIADLAGEVACERWSVLAREDRPLAPISILPADAWPVFTVEDWEHGTAQCRYTGAFLFDLHFRPLKTASEATVMMQAADELGAKDITDAALIGGNQRKTQPTILAKTALAALFPAGVPSLRDLSNKKLLGLVQDWFAKGEGVPPSADTIWRAAGRRARRQQK